MDVAIKAMELSNKLKKIERVKFSENNLMKYEFDTLAIITNLTKQKGKVNASDIAGINGMPMPAVSRLLNNMDAKGLTYRETDPQSRRNVLVKITEKGSALYNTFMLGTSQFFNKILDNLSEAERHTFLATTEKLFAFTDALLDEILNPTESDNV